MKTLKAEPSRNSVRNPRWRKRGLTFLLAVALGATAHAARASWWGVSVKSLDVQGVTLGMTLEEVTKLHPEMKLSNLDADWPGNVQLTQSDLDMMERCLAGPISPRYNSFIVTFAPQNMGSKVESLYLDETPTGLINAGDLLAQIEKKYGSPTDVEGGDLAASTTRVTATWGMTVAESLSVSPRETGQVLRIEIDKTDGDAEVTFILENYALEHAADVEEKAYLAQKAKAVSDRNSNALSY